MKLKYYNIAGIVLMSVLLMTSCKKKNELGRFIPADASVVVHVNAAALNNKLPWSEIRENAFFKMLSADSAISDMAKSALEDPANTGIDIKKDISFFMAKDTLGSYVAIVGKIKDAQKFKDYNTSVLQNATASEQNGVQFISRKGYVSSWDKDKFILVADLHDLEHMKYRDSIDMPVTPTASRDVVPVAASIYNLSENMSLAGNEQFGEMAENKGDLHMWVNAKALYENTGDIPGFPMLNLNKLFDNAYTAATANFENGFIKIESKFYAGKEMTNLWKKYGGANINSGMVKRIPANDVAIFFALNFKPEGIKAFLQMMGLDGLANLGLSAVGFNLDDFEKANKGDVMIAVSGIRMEADSSALPTDTARATRNTKLNADFLFSASIGKKDAFNKLIDAGNKFSQQGMSPELSNLSYSKNDKYFAIGNNQAHVNQFIAKESNNKFAFLDKVSASPFAVYIDLHAILTAFRPAAARDSLDAIVMDASLRIWENIVISGGEFANGAMTQHVEINLLDKNTNSLKQLNRYTGQLAVVAIAKKEQHKAKASRNEVTRRDSVLLKK